MFNLKELKESLAECHVRESSITYRCLREIVDKKYFLLRAKECVESILLGESVESNLVMSIQLLNMYRVMSKTKEKVVTKEKRVDPRDVDERLQEINQIVDLKDEESRDKFKDPSVHSPEDQDH